MKLVMTELNEKESKEYQKTRPVHLPDNVNCRCDSCYFSKNLTDNKCDCTSCRPRPTSKGR